MADLTPDEIAFFDTGELPTALVDQAAATAASVAAVQPSVEDVKPEVAAEPAEAVEAAETKVGQSPTTDTLLQQFMAEERTRRLALEEQLKELQAKLTEKLTPKELEPDEETDPLGAMMHKLNLVNSQVAELQTKLTAEQQNNLLKQQFEQFTDSVRTLKDTFEKTTPDFKDAYAHIRNIHSEDLRMQGVAESDIPQALLKDELQLAQIAIQRGKNPAEELYNAAKRYGYTTKTVAKQPTPNDKIAALQAGVAASKTVQKGGAESELTLAGLKDASSADLNKLVQDDALWAKVVGGTSGSKDIF